MTGKHSRSIGILLLFLGALTLPLTAFAQGAATFFVTNVDASRFPDIQFQLRAVELDNKVVTNLNSANLSVYEDGQLVPDAQVTPRDDGPINVIFVIDQGRLANYQSFGLSNIRLAISTLVSGGYFVDGRDTVQALGRQNINSDQTVTLLPPTHSGADLTTWAANFNFQRGNNATKGLLGVDEAITAMTQLVPLSGSQTAAVIFITRYVEDPSSQVAVTAAQNTAATAKQGFISVYAFQTDLSRTYNQPLQALATGATGVYVPLNRNTVTTDVSSVYQAIAAQRTVYTVAYRSTVGTSGKRQITINAAQPPATGVAGSYEVALQPPTVSIVEPTIDSTLRREAKPSADGTIFSYDISRVKVTADVSWPNNPRNIKSAQLFANGVLQGAVQPPSGATSIEFEWDISDVVKEGLNPIQLEVGVTDELGVEASASSTVNVEVVLPPPPEPEDPTTAFLSKYWVVLALGSAGLLAVIPISLLILFMTRPKQPQEQAGPAQFGGGAQDTLIGIAPSKQKGLGAIQVIEGPKGLIGENINIYKTTTTLGRSPESADIVFYPNEQSSVSRLHCTVQFDGRTFKLTDNNSTSGTWLNGRRIRPNVSVELRDEDEVILGDLTKLGARFRFYASPDKAQLKSQKDADHTMIIIEDDSGKEDLEKYKDD